MTHSHRNSVDAVSEKIRRHNKYYLSNGDVHFLVENYLFRVHRYFFERESAWFRERFAVAAGPGQNAKGSSDANAFPLDDILANDFARFLWVFYNPKYSIYDATIEDWTAILKLAYDWRFAEVKKLCCRELEKFDIAPVQKIELYQTYELDKKLLIPSYIAMCTRQEPLSVKEGRQLGLETALLIATARETTRGRAASRVQGSPSLAALEDEDLVTIMKDVFGIAVTPSSPSLSPLEGGFGGSPSRLRSSVLGLSPTPGKASLHATEASSFSTVTEVFGNASPTPTMISTEYAKPSAKSLGNGAGANGNTGNADANDTESESKAATEGDGEGEEGEKDDGEGGDPALGTPAKEESNWLSSGTKGRGHKNKKGGK